MSALISAVTALWPGRQVELTRANGITARAGFLVVPNRAHPRLLVPVGHPAAASRALRRYSSALGVREVASRAAVSAVLRTTGSRAFRDRLELPGSEESVEDQLSRILGEPVVCSVGVGNDRANRKPVLQVFDRKGHTLGYAKVALTPLAGELVDVEHQALREVARHPLPSRLEVPDVLWYGDWNGLPILLISALVPSVASTVRLGDVPAPRQVMHELSTAFGRSAMPLARTPSWAGVRATAQRHSDPVRAAHLQQALEVIEAHAGGDDVELGAWHGDWTPWNMGRRGRQILLWDWERFGVDVPLGLDPLHYAVNARIRRQGLTSGSVLAGLADAGEPSGVDRAGESLSAAAYLAMLAARSLEAVEAQNGPVARQAATVMLDALRSWTRT